MTRNTSRHYRNTLSQCSSSSDNLFDPTIPSPRMGCCNCRTLGCVGVLWVLLSFLATSLSCIGFYSPFWLEGSMRNNTPTYLGLWRRCNYLKVAEDNAAAIEIVYECGRYATFMDIPSIWWQIGTVTVGTGCGLLILVTFLGMFGCCCAGVISHRTAKVCAHIQLFAG